MGIGRREFLRRFGAGIAAAANSTAAIAIADNRYINRRLGIAFEKPPEWVFSDVKQMADVKAGQILDFDDPELSRLIVETIEVPILTISQETISADSDRFTPGVAVNLDRFTPEEASLPDALSPVESLEFDSEACADIFKDFRSISPVTPSSISACDAAQYDATFIFEHKKMSPVPVRMKTLVIDQLTAFYTIRMFDSPHLGGTLVFDYSPFIASIRMV
jgi:hypothetical protein